MNEKNVLCAANNYEQKYYFNPRFSNLPQEIQKELNIISVLFTTRIGGLITFYFDDEDGSVMIETDHDEADALYDEIGSALEVKRLRKDEHELFEQLELYYMTMFLEENEEV